MLASYLTRAFGLLLLLTPALGMSTELHAANEQAISGGIIFECPSTNIDELANTVTSYFDELGIPTQVYKATQNTELGLLHLSLGDPGNITNTLNLFNRPEFDIKEDVVEIPHGKRMLSIVTTSKKEIVLAMLQNGRTTQFRGAECAVDALKDQVNIRQNIVAWTESAQWLWVDGRPAKWNAKYWNKGKYNPHHPLHVALNDIFTHSERYFFGCYTATKVLITVAVLDYYGRIKHDEYTYQSLIRRLLQDGDPLANIEPGEMWSFEKGYEKTQFSDSGKLMHLSDKLPNDNFIPGDWAYFVNTDEISSKKNGYEGANTIYLGRGLFSDYYNDNNHHFTFREQIDEVYQWRNHVYSRPQDNKKIKPLSEKDIQALSKDIFQGGLLLNYRAFPINQ